VNTLPPSSKHAIKTLGVKRMVAFFNHLCNKAEPQPNTFEHLGHFTTP